MRTFEERLQKRKEQFVARTISGIPEVFSRITALQNDPGNASELRELHRQFHKMSGAGGIYQLQEFCELATTAEGICAPYLEGQNPVTEADSSRLQTIVQAILAVLDRA